MQKRHSVGQVKFCSDEWELANGKRLIILNGSLAPADHSNAKYKLEAYLRHIGAEQGSRILCLKDLTVFDVSALDEDEMATAQRWLAGVIALWAEGQKLPLPFSLEIGSHFAHAIINDDEPDTQALLTQAYDTAWTNEHSADDDSPAQRLCFDDDSPAAPDSRWRDEYAAHAELIMKPVLSWATEVIEGSE